MRRLTVGQLLIQIPMLCLVLLLGQPGYAQENQSTNNFSVMTYNIQQLGYANWMADHFEKERLALIPGAIFALDEHPDVVVLQEVFTEHAFEFLVKAMSSEYPYHTDVVAQDCNALAWTSVAGDCQTYSLRGNGGVVVFSRWPLVEQHAYVYRAFRVSSTFDFMAQKGVVYARILINGQRVHILGTHLQARADDASHNVRMRQLEEMRVWFDRFKVPKSEVVILAGDFNVSSNTPEKLEQLLQVTRTSFELSWQEIGSISPGSNDYLNLISSRNAEKTLDFVLTRTDHLQPTNRPLLKVLNFKSVNPWIGKQLFGENIELHDLSDHYPTITVFEF